MASIVFDLCPELELIEGVTRDHYEGPDAAGFQASYAIQEDDESFTRLLWRWADRGVLKRILDLWNESAQGVLPMDYAFQFDGGVREVLFVEMPVVRYDTAYTGRVSVRLKEAR